MKEILLETGLGGHLKHLYENHELTFGDLKEFFNLASRGVFEEATEKVDGQNLFISWCPIANKLVAARNKSDIKNGGLDEFKLSERFSKFEENVKNTFIEAYTALDNIFIDLTFEEKQSIFGNSSCWFSIEIVDPQNTNVIKYDKKSIIFHKNPLVLNEGMDGFSNLSNIFNKLQGFSQKAGYQLYLPIVIANITPNIKLINSLNNRSEELRKIYVLETDCNLKKFIKTRLINDCIKEIGIQDDKMNAFIADHMLSNFGKVTLKELRKHLPKDKVKKIKLLLQNKKTLQEKAIEPIKEIIKMFSSDLLKNIDSKLITNKNKTIENIKDNFKQTTKQIIKSNNPMLLETLDDSLQRLGSIENIDFTLEGIVFKFNGSIYKLTGNFPEVNKVLGILKYNRNS